jgi:predicted MFS family arabinose efflux permease
MWSLAIIVTGIGISMLNKINRFVLFGESINVNEYHVLLFFIIISTSSIYFILNMDESPPRSESSRFKNNFRNLLLDYDWFLMIKALVPTMLIAVGAGLTIPFINLFFFSVFDLDSGQFGILGSAASFLGFSAILFAPTIKRRYGFRSTILLTQFIAIALLIILSLTELFTFLHWIIIIAIVSYLLRQPLMHMAAPVTSELTMKYVGEKNQELVSAVNSSIWSASWFLSAKIFQFLRSIDYPYYIIFLITALLYAIGVTLYSFIIREYEERSVEILREEVFEQIIHED